MSPATPRKRTPRKATPIKAPEHEPTSQIAARRVEELVPDPANVNTHDERSIEALQASLRRFGQPRPILIDTKDVVVAGNGLLEAARREGWDWIDTNTFHGTAAEARAYSIADNRLPQLSKFDADILREQVSALRPDLQVALGWQPEQLAELIGPVDLPSVDDDEPAAPPSRARVKSKLGDEWLLGNHTLVVGENADAGSVGEVDDLCRYYQESTGQMPVRKSTGKAVDFSR